MLTTAAPAPMKEETLLPYTTKMAHCCNILLGMPLLNAPPPLTRKIKQFSFSTHSCSPRQKNQLFKENKMLF